MSQNAPHSGSRPLAVWLWSGTAAAARKLGSALRKVGARAVAGELAATDVDEIAARLDIESRARADGENERPATTEQSVTGVQREIVVYFEKLERTALRRAHALAGAMRKQQEKIDLLEAGGKLRDIPSKCESDMLRVRTAFQSRLALLEEREAQQRLHYASFRERNRLDRVAEYPQSLLAQAAVVATLVAAAAIAGRGVSLSPAGYSPLSVSWAATILLDVLVPFLLGATIFRGIHHVHAGKRLAGWLAGAAVMALIATLALVVPVSFAIAAGDPTLTLRTLLESPSAAPALIGTHLAAWSTDITAWTGSGAIVAAGLIAFFAGYKSDDPYPGYGVAQRAYYRARRQREVLVSGLQRRLDAIVDAAEAQAAALWRRLNARVRAYAKLVGESERASASLHDYGTTLEEACNILLDRYRTLNASVRRTPAPLCFSARVSLGAHEDRAAALFGDADARLVESQSAVAELERALATLRQRLKDLSRPAAGGLWDSPGKEEAGA